MSGENSYKVIPSELLELNAVQNFESSLDPLSYGYQILFDKLKIQRTGVMHLGGHIGQELPMYVALGFRNIVMVEPLEEEFQILDYKISRYNEMFYNVSNFLETSSPLTQAYALKCAVSDKPSVAKFYRTGISSLSSLAEPIETGFSENINAVSYEEVSVPCKTLDEIINELPNNWTAKDFNYLRMNIQGSELNALKGAKLFLQSISLIDLEINIEPRYKGNPTKNEIDLFLNQCGFHSVFNYSINSNVGNILYARSNNNP